MYIFLFDVINLVTKTGNNHAGLNLKTVKLSP